MTTKSDKANQPAPRYDDVHADGVAWLDELATEEATDRGTERLVEIDPTEVERVRTGPVTAEEAMGIAHRFVSGHFGNAGKEGPRISIPADPMRDDDLRLVAFIEQSAAEIERLKRDLEGVKEREREHVTRAQDVADEMRRERDAAIAERDELRVTLENRALAGAGVAFDIKELQDELLLAQDSVMRMRRELKALQDDMRRRADASDGELFDDLLTRVLKEYADRITAILAGAKS